MPKISLKFQASLKTLSLPREALLFKLLTLSIYRPAIRALLILVIILLIIFAKD
jgi:hypothetical protein